MELETCSLTMIPLYLETMSETEVSLQVSKPLRMEAIERAARQKSFTTKLLHVETMEAI